MTPRTIVRASLVTAAFVPILTIGNAGPVGAHGEGNAGTEPPNALAHRGPDS